MTIFAKVLTYLFQPLLIPLFGVFLYFQLQSTHTMMLHPELKNTVYLIVVIPFTIVFPGISLLLLYRSKAISSLHIRRREERLLPYIVFMLYYGMAYYLMNQFKSYMPPSFFSFLLAGIVAVIAGFTINFFVKISVHAIAFFNVAGALIACSQVLPMTSKTESIIINSSLLILGGLVAWSRLHLSAHNPKEIWLGIFVGLASGYFVVAGGVYL
jgi:hypothetical protein